MCNQHVDGIIYIVDTGYMYFGSNKLQDVQQK